MGANFCHVIKIKLLVQDIFSIRLGNHIWNGVIPIFNINVNIINVMGIFIFVIKYLLKK